jgi:hypothetical protein
MTDEVLTMLARTALEAIRRAQKEKEDTDDKPRAAG